MGDHTSPGNPAGPHHACQRCGAQLRPGRACAPCSGRLDVAELLREAGFFTREAIRQALARYDFGYLFRAVRRTAGLTQQQLGDLLDLDQDRISRIERGTRSLRDIATVARVATRLGIPPELLGFNPDAASVADKGAGKTREEVDGVIRRDFSWIVAGITLDLSVDALDIERLDQLLPTEPAERTITRIGAADVATIEQGTALLRNWNFSRGGGSCRPAAVAQLRSALPLLDTESTSEVRERLLMAVADLGMVAAWTSYDTERHDEARRLWILGLNLAQQIEHPRGADLTAHLLMNMAHQSLHLRRPQEAGSFLQLGYSTAARRAQPLLASTASHLASYQAWSKAAQGDARGCDRVLGHAVEHFTHADQTTTAPWAAHITDAELAAMEGHARYILALVTSNPKHAARAVPLLQQAVAGFGPAYARSRAVNLPGLAGAHTLTGDFDAAARIGHHAVQEITALASPRAYERLRILDTVLQSHATNPALSDLRAQIQAALPVT